MLHQIKAQQFLYLFSSINHYLSLAFFKYNVNT